MSLKERYIQGMVLSGLGDAFAYRNGQWEFCHSGAAIYKELQSIGGLDNVSVKLPMWPVSDDTVMHLATGEALISPECQDDREKLFLRMASLYKECMKDMSGRSPGNTCQFGTHQLKPLIKKGYQIPFNARGGGCGAAMRSMCIGLRYPRPEQLQELICVSIESGRMTHHHPTGFLGSLAGALFTSYSVQGKNPWVWGKGLMETLPLALEYITTSGHCVEENKEAWAYFTDQWEKYLKLRGLQDGNSAPVFPDKFDFEERDKFYKSVSFSGWGGSSGHDAPMIAYDAYLGANGVWLELCNRALFHGGDSDSTGVMAACWFGISHGWDQVSPKNYKSLEYRGRLEAVGASLYDMAFPDGPDEKFKIDVVADETVQDDSSKAETSQTDSSSEKIADDGGKEKKAQGNN